MQAYGAAFARVYNLLWGDFSNYIAPRLLDFYATRPANNSLLDICCGTGQVALHFLKQGYHVTGLDLSSGMLHYAENNAEAFVLTGQARFVQADAAAFKLDESFGLIVSLFDALNHLPDWAALRGCFQSARAVCAPGGTFIFDLNTRLGLKRWNNISIQETDEVLLVNRGIYDGGDKAFAHITGFIREDDGCYSRFEETVYNTVFDLTQVRDLLLETGWHDPYFASATNLAAPLTDPEHEGRVFFVASA